MPSCIGRSDGVVTLRPHIASDAEAHLAGEDEEQRRWLWDEEARTRSAGMTTAQRREHVKGWVDATMRELAAGGPRLGFAVVAGTDLVGYVEAQLKGRHDLPEHVNVSYVIFPAFRRRGYAVRAVQLLVEELARIAPGRRALLVVGPANLASLAVAERCGFRRRDDIREHGVALQAFERTI